jgi:hypothetical protein
VILCSNIKVLAHQDIAEVETPSEPQAQPLHLVNKLTPLTQYPPSTPTKPCAHHSENLKPVTSVVELQTSTMSNQSDCQIKSSAAFDNSGSGDSIATGFIIFLILSRLVYGAVQAHLGRGYGNFFQRFLQNTMSCCSIEPEEDIEKVADLGGADMSGSKSMRKMSRQSRKMSRIEDGVEGKARELVQVSKLSNRDGVVWMY